VEQLRPFLSLPLFSGVRGRGIFRNWSSAGSGKSAKPRPSTYEHTGLRIASSGYYQYFLIILIKEQPDCGVP
jgi:hypothetical protein